MRVGELNPLTAERLMVVDVEAPLQVVARSFLKPGTGLVIACHGTGVAAGVLSKFDLVRHMASAEIGLGRVSTLMSSPFVSCNPADDLHSTWQIMAEKGLRNLPVLGSDAKPIGVLDIRDAMKALFEQEEAQEQFLSNYIAGIGYQ